MKYIIEKDSAVPAYLQLYGKLRSDIINGIYPHSSKLPSKRVIADETGVSTVTAEHAYALLCDEGYVESRERSGYFVIFRQNDGFAAASEKKNILRESNYRPQSDEASPEFPFSVLTKTMRGVINDFGPSLLRRPPNPGCVELRTAIKEYLARSKGVFAENEQIIIGAGSEYLYGMIVELLGRNRVFGIEYPSYKKIEQVYKACGANYETLPLGRDGIESKKLEKSRADVLHITPYRSYPSGVTASASKRHEYVRWAEKGGRYIIEDDFESEFSISRKPEETLFALSQNDNVIYMNTFSKTVSPSLRVGYMVLPKKLAPIFDKNLGFYSCTVSAFVQLVLAQLISNGDFERHINRVRRRKRKQAEK